MYVHVEFSSPLPSRADLHSLAEKLTRLGIRGWCHIDAGNVRGRFICLKREQASALELIGGDLGEVSLTEVATTEHLPPGLRQFYILPAPVFRAGNARVMIDRIGHRGEISGWAFDPTRPHDRLTLLITIDGAPAGSTQASNFRLDLLRAGIGDGGHGFSANTPPADFSTALLMTSWLLPLAHPSRKRR